MLLFLKISYWWLSIFALKPLTTYLSPTVPPRLTGRITGAQDYFHVIVVSQGCVTHQMPNPVSFPMPGTQGSGCRSDRVFKLYEGVTDAKQTRKREQASAKTNRKNDEKQWVRSGFCHSNPVRPGGMMYRPKPLWTLSTWDKNCHRVTPVMSFLVFAILFSSASSNPGGLCCMDTFSDLLFYSPGQSHGATSDSFWDREGLLVSILET